MKVLRVFLTVALFSAVLAVNGDKGLGVDPNGGLRAAAATADDGIGIDPNGGLRH